MERAFAHTLSENVDQLQSLRPAPTMGRLRAVTSRRKREAAQNSRKGPDLKTPGAIQPTLAEWAPPASLAGEDRQPRRLRWDGENQTTPAYPAFGSKRTKTTKT